MRQPAAPRARFAALSRTSAVRCADQIGQFLALGHAELPPVLGVTRVHALPSRFLLRSHRHTVGDDAPGVRGDSRTSVVPVLAPTDRDPDVQEVGHTDGGPVLATRLFLTPSPFDQAA